MYKPEMKQALELSKGFDLLPITREIYSDIKTPIEVLKILKTVSKHCYILESVENQEVWGRYTFLGYDPVLGITAKGNKIVLDYLKKEKSSEEYLDINPKTFIEDILKNYKSASLEGLPTFTGGLVGYFSYDYIKYSEKSLNLDANDTENFNDVDLMLFDKVIAFDNLKQKIILIANMIVKDGENGYEEAINSIKEMEELIKNKIAVEPEKGELTTDIKALFSKEEFCEMVEKAKKHIFEGDIFQVVLSNRLEAGFKGSLFDMYRVLRTINPSPYMFYLSSSDLEVAGASPETLVKLEDKVLHTFPLAGTRKRGETKKEDEALEKELLADEKEVAEHNMLVDLGRNDLGKISKFNTVEVEKYMTIEKYSHVMHIGSTVRGIIDDKYNSLDAINAVLPAGTLSGAPKIRACEIINKLENNKRGIYGGAVGYIDFKGNMDTCIAIRLAFKKNDKVFVRSGAGIVADSVPESEYQECINKAKAVINALEASKEV